MATLTTVTTPDGVVHNLGGGGGNPITYNIGYGAQSGNTVPFVLTGSNGTTDTVYFTGSGNVTLSASGDTLTITSSGGQSVTYTLSGSGTANDYTITNTPSSGTASSATIPSATQSAAGVMTSADKTKLDGIQSGAEANVQADWSQSNTSADDYIKNKPSLATVATTGDYDDLTNKPSLATVATTGDYDDLTNKPTIPTVNDATLTIQKNGTDVETFTANSSTNKTANITVPTQASDIGAQEELVSGTNIKTINGTSILGSGNITTPDDDTTYSISETDGVVTLTGSDSSTSSVNTVTDVEVNGSSVVVDGVASITGTGIPHVNLTQAQYDALSDADKNNGTIYFITDGQGTAEEIIGTGTLNTTAQTLIGAVNELAVDYIIEEGMSNPWSYRKWSGGKVECWTLLQSVSITSGYIKISLPTVFTFQQDHPYAFITEWYGTDSNRGVHSYHFNYGGTQDSRTTIVFYVRTSSGSTPTGYVALSIYLIGTWK